MSAYILQLLINFNLFFVFALSLNLLVGSGIITLAHAGVIGIGAYTYLIATMQFSLPEFVALLCALGSSFAISLLLSLFSNTLRHDYFVLATLALQLSLTSVFKNLSITGGVHGVVGIPKIQVAWWTLNTLPTVALGTSLLSLILIVCFFYLYASPFGRLLKTVREDPLAAASLGKNVALARRSAFILAAGVAVIGAIFYSSHLGYIHPEEFGLSQSIFLLSLVLVGGTGNVQGPVVGAMIFTLIPEILKWAALPSHVAANLEQIIFGVLVLCLLRFRPQGLAGEYRVK